MLELVRHVFSHYTNMRYFCILWYRTHHDCSLLWHLTRAHAFNGSVAAATAYIAITARSRLTRLLRDNTWQMYCSFVVLFFFSLYNSIEQNCTYVTYDILYFIDLPFCLARMIISCMYTKSKTDIERIMST